MRAFRLIHVHVKMYFIFLQSWVKLQISVRIEEQPFTCDSSDKAFRRMADILHKQKWALRAAQMNDIRWKNGCSQS
jgi:hypothetical protein